MKLNKHFIPLSLLIFFPVLINGQTTESISIADSLHRSYKFQEAITLYQSILKASDDSLFKIEVDEKILQCENGINLLLYASQPNPVALQRFPKDSFVLYIPSLKEYSWMHIPNPMVDDRPHNYYNYIYFPEESDTLFFSAPDKSDSWNIYQTHRISDNLWSEPQLLNESITSSGDEIFPLLSADGKELYFASNGHFGMGGFDLYVSRWDESIEDWSAPENLGFPYSSTSDDLLYFNTTDGKYSIVASSRNVSADSVGLFVLDYIGTPIKKPVSLIEAINISKLSPFVMPLEKHLEEIKQPDELPTEINGMSHYSTLVSETRTLQNELRKLLAELEENRLLLETLESEDDKMFLKEIIADSEAKVQMVRKELETATGKVQAAEMEFLAKGIIPQFDEPAPKKETPKQASAPSFTFVKVLEAELRDIEIEKPIPLFDYSFKILPEAQFAEDNTLPPTLVYQIQLIVTSTKATLKSFKGLSPIFERLQKSGKYLYTVGLFYTHTEALSCLNQVRKAGFSKAFVVAFNNGKSLSIKEAKILEKTAIANNAAYQVILADYPDGIPSPIMAAIKESCDKDIAKVIREGKNIYIIGTFAEKNNADYVVKILTGLGVTGVSVEQVK